MADDSLPLPQGTLDLLILKTLASGARHGYGLARWLEETTDDVLSVQEGALYPALYRMERRGWVKAEWSQSDIGKDIKRYALTPKGRTELKRKSAQWDGLTSAVAKVMRA
jgi:transcriptional regulator